MNLIVRSSAACLILLLTAPAARPDPLQIRLADWDLVPRSGEGAEELAQAVGRFEKGDFEGCLTSLEAAGKRNPGLFPAKLLLAKLFVSHHQLAPGRAVLEQVVVDHPDLPEGYLLFATVALEDGRIADAAVHLEKALALAQTDRWTAERKRMFAIGTQSGLAEVAERRGNWALAQKHLLAWSAVDPDNPRVHRRLGSVLFHQKQYPKALEEFSRSVRADDRQEAPAMALARLFADAGDFPQAAEWITAAVRGDPNNIRVRLAAADLFLQQERWKEAEAEADAIARLDPKSTDLLALRGLIAWYAKDYPLAEHFYQEWHDRAPSRFAASNNLALALLQQPDKAKHRRALELARANARTYPRIGEAQSTLGWAYYRTGQLEQAERSLRDALATRTAGADTAYYLARLLADQGRSDEARPFLEMALHARGHFSYRREAQRCAEELKKK